MVESHPKFESEKDRVKQLIVRVGDQGQEHFKRDLSKLHTVALKYAEVSEDNKAFIVDLIVESASLINHKASIYATFIALASTKNPSLGEMIVERLFENLQKHLDKGDIMVPKSLLLVYGELMNLGIINSFNFIKVLLDINKEAENTLSVSRDYYLYLSISVLPHVVEGLMKKSQIEFKNLIQITKTLMNKRNLSYTSVMNPTKDKKPTDRLTEYWRAILEYIESENRGPIKSIPRPYKDFGEELASVTQLKKSSVQKLYFNSKVAENCVYQSPCHFQTFDGKVLEEEVTSRLDQLILRETANDLILYFSH